MNIIFKESCAKSYYKVIQQITKSNGCCCSNYKWIKCSYWRYKNEQSFCKLFTEFIYKNKSLHVCNVIYGSDFIGDP